MGWSRKWFWERDETHSDMKMFPSTHCFLITQVPLHHQNNRTSSPSPTSRTTIPPQHFNAPSAVDILWIPSHPKKRDHLNIRIFRSRGAHYLPGVPSAQNPSQKSPVATSRSELAMLRHGIRWARPGRWSSTVTLRWADGREAGAFLPKYLRENTMDAG